MILHCHSERSEESLVRMTRIWTPLLRLCPFASLAGIAIRDYGTGCGRCVAPSLSPTACFDKAAGLILPCHSERSEESVVRMTRIWTPLLRLCPFASLAGIAVRDYGAGRVRCVAPSPPPTVCFGKGLGLILPCHSERSEESVGRMTRISTPLLRLCPLASLAAIAVRDYDAGRGSRAATSPPPTAYFGRGAGLILPCHSERSEESVVRMTRISTPLLRLCPFASLAVIAVRDYDAGRGPSGAS